jgi:alkylhydroperoxidase family enzyme
VIATPRRLGEHCTTSRQRVLADLATTVTLAPWTLSDDHRAHAHAAGLTDEDILHAVVLSSYFGHLNRIADATGVPLDYQVAIAPPAVDASVPPLAPAPEAFTGRPAIELAMRPATYTALADWRTYIYDRDAPLTRRQRTFIVRSVAEWLGDAGISSPADLTANPLDAKLHALAETVTLAPWRLSDSSFAPLRAEGFDDAALFDVCATASSAGVWLRVEVALVALAR